MTLPKLLGKSLQALKEQWTAEREGTPLSNILRMYQDLHLVLCQAYQDERLGETHFSFNGEGHLNLEYFLNTTYIRVTGRQLYFPPRGLFGDRTTITAWQKKGSFYATIKSVSSSYFDEPRVQQKIALETHLQALLQKRPDDVSLYTAIPSYLLNGLFERYGHLRDRVRQAEENIEQAYSAFQHMLRQHLLNQMTDKSLSTFFSALSEEEKVHFFKAVLVLASEEQLSRIGTLLSQDATTKKLIGAAARPLLATGPIRSADA